MELYSPMQIHWKAKWLSLPYDGEQILLRGLSASSDSELVFQLFLVEQPSAVELSASVSADIQAILDAYPTIFTTPSSLPPQRSCDHAIPLISGATPVNIRAYRYPPSLKDEIERQVHAMLTQGPIQPSTSPFSSLVLMVRKKDGIWRFCVDYRYLDTLTVKSVYPIPIFDQLVDELGQASWFTILDLHSGYHQIRLQPGEEFKTAFSTHAGQYEFTVVPYGLSGAPGTLSPLLRRCVIIFFDDILVYSSSYEEHLDTFDESCCCWPKTSG